MAEEKITARPRGTDSARVIRIVETRSIIGNGDEGDPVRQIIQYWDFDGNLLAQRDSYLDSGLETGG